MCGCSRIGIHVEPPWVLNMTLQQIGGRGPNDPKPQNPRMNDSKNPKRQDSNLTPETLNP